MGYGQLFLTPLLARSSWAGSAAALAWNNDAQLTASLQLLE